MNPNERKPHMTTEELNAMLGALYESATPDRRQAMRDAVRAALGLDPDTFDTLKDEGENDGSEG